MAGPIAKEKKNAHAHTHTHTDVTPLICHCALRLAPTRARRERIRPGSPFPVGLLRATKLPGCHSNWPDGEQSGLLRGICQHGVAVTSAAKALLALRFPFAKGVGERARDEGTRGDPAVCLGRQQCGVLATVRRKTGTIATCRDACMTPQR